MSGMLTELPTMWTWLLPSAMAGKLSGLKVGYRCVIYSTRITAINLFFKCIDTRLVPREKGGAAYDSPTGALPPDEWEQTLVQGFE